MNILLDDTQRELYKPVIKYLFDLCPDMMGRKISEANVQQAFVFNTVNNLRNDESKILAVGCHEDTAYEALKKLGVNVIGVDPLINMSLDTFFKITQQVNGVIAKDKFDIIFSTSVIEHVENDEQFIEQICKLLNPNGIAILTCDFRNDWVKGNPKPDEDKKLYTKHDLTVRLNNILKENNCSLYGKIDYEGEPDFYYGNYHYNFATLTFKKEA